MPTDETWRTWTKQEVVVRLPEGEPSGGLPRPVRLPGRRRWRMLVGGGLAGGVPVVWMFTSSDLRTWAYVGRASRVARGPRRSGSARCWWTSTGARRWWWRTASRARRCTCPTRGCEPRGDRLVVGEWRRLGYGALYAASTFLDADGRPGLVHWVREVGDGDAGWAGVTSLPHLLARDGDRLVARPPTALDAVGEVVGVVERGGTLRATTSWRRWEGSPWSSRPAS